MDRATAKAVIRFHAAHVTEHPTGSESRGMLIELRVSCNAFESDLLEVIEAVRVLEFELVHDPQILAAYYDLVYHLELQSAGDWVPAQVKERVRDWRMSLGWPLSCMLNEVVLGTSDLKLAFEGFDSEDWKGPTRRASRD